MKKQVIAMVALAGMAMGASLAYGAPGSNGGGIVGSKHDMNMYVGSHGGTNDLEGRVCAFCHTPHHALGITDNNQATITWTDAAGAGQSTTYTVYSPLWSRTIDASKTFDSYASVTFNPAAQGNPYDNLIGPSRLCMTCHDGLTAGDSYYNQKGGSTTGDDTLDYFGSDHFAVGGNGGLSNDHPIGMRYNDYYNVKGFELKDPAVSTFNAPTVKKINDVLFSDTIGGDANAKGYVTCASCHDVHNGNEVGNRNPNKSQRGYFLRATQNASEFCIVCHDKNS